MHVLDCEQENVSDVTIADLTVSKLKFQVINFLIAHHSLPLICVHTLRYFL